MKLPYRSRNPEAYRDLAAQIAGRLIDCGAYLLDCSRWCEAGVRYIDRRVYDRLSGLKLRLRIPVIVFRSSDGEVCSVEVKWDGEWFRLGCEELEKCCRRATRGP